MFLVKRVSLFDSSNFACRFDKVLSWPTDLGQPPTMGAFSSNSLTMGISKAGIKSMKSADDALLKLGGSRAVDGGSVDNDSLKCSIGAAASSATSVGQKITSEAMSSLIHSFFQFATEHDAGEVSRVKFSVGSGGGACSVGINGSRGAQSSAMRHHRSRSRTGPVLNGVSKRAGASGLGGACEDIYLHCLRGRGNILVATFVQYASGPAGVSAQEEVDKFLTKVDEIAITAGSDTDQLKLLIDELIVKNKEANLTATQNWKNTRGTIYQRRQQQQNETLVESDIEMIQDKE